jgi:hypothetical protein
MLLYYVFGWRNLRFLKVWVVCVCVCVLMVVLLMLWYCCGNIEVFRILFLL